MSRDEIDRLREAIEDKPPPADVRLLALANRALCEQVDRLTAGIQEALGNGADEESWPPGLTEVEAVARLRSEHTTSRELLAGSWHKRIAELTDERDDYRDGVSVTAAVLAETIRERDAARKLLRRLEWEHTVLNRFHSIERCQVCDESRADGHAPNCELAALLGGDRG